MKAKAVSELLDWAAARYGSRPALGYAGDGPTWMWTYAELHAQTGRVAAWLQTKGVGPGSRVILWAPNSPWWVAAYFATLRLGAVVVPLDVRSTPDFVGRIIGQTEPVIGLLGAGTPDGWPESVPSAQMESFADLPAAPPPATASTLSPRNLAVIAYTSGTTGDPKGVMLTHANILSNAIAVNKLVPFFPAYRLLSVLPLSHMLEEIIGLLVPFMRGASVTYTASRQSTVLFKAIQEGQITTILLVPEALDLIMKAIESEVRAQGKEGAWQTMQHVAEWLPAPARRLLFRQVHQRFGGHLDFLMCGGAHLDPVLIHKWDMLGVPVLQGYGTTEASPVVAIEPLEARNPHAVGKAIPGVQIRLTADGEILVKGPNITQGYWKNAQVTADSFADGWYKTGDLGELDEKGYLYIKGRIKDRIVLASGQKVYPEDVEEVVKAVPGVRDATVVGMPSPHGPVVHAVLMVQNPQVDVAAVVRQANAKLGSHQQIRGYSTWPDEDFPRTALRKVKKHEVLAALQAAPANVLTIAAPTPVFAAAGTRAARVIQLAADLAHVDPAVLTPDATLGEAAGMDSLTEIELLAQIDRELGVHIDETNISPTTTIGELLALVEYQPKPPTLTDAVPTPAAPIPAPTDPQGRPAPLVPTIPPGALRNATVGQKAFRLFARTVFSAFLRVDVIGRENLPRTPAVLCVNHLGWADLFSPLLFLPVEPRIYVVGEEHVKYRGLLNRLLIDWLHIMIPLDRSHPLGALHQMAETIQPGGGSILIYPEGIVGHAEGVLQPLQEGAAQVAILAGAPLVPIGITGAADLWWRKCLTLRIGEPIDPATAPGAPEIRRADLTARLATAMQALMPGETPQPGRKRLKRWLTHLF
jgi:long-chain acyl-CoA synthetase